MLLNLKIFRPLDSLFGFIEKFLKQFARYNEQPIRATDEAWTRNPRIFEELSKELKSLKIRFKRPDNVYRDYRANGLTKGDSSIKFPMTNPATSETFAVSVYDYFKTYSPYKVNQTWGPFQIKFHAGKMITGGSKYWTCLVQWGFQIWTSLDFKWSGYRRGSEIRKPNHLKSGQVDAIFSKTI